MWNFADAVAFILLLPMLCLLLAGAGWRKLSLALGTSFGASVIAGAIAAVIAIFLQGSGPAGGSGEWAGIGRLGVALLVGFLTALIIFAGILSSQTRSKPDLLKRAPIATSLLIAGGLLVLILVVYPAVDRSGLLIHIVRSSSLASRLGRNSRSAQVESELIRRGPEAVPAVVAELHRHPYQKTNPGDAIEMASVPPLLGVLARIGGPDATTEIRRWTAPEVPPHVRTLAIDLLATQGDSSVLPTIEQLLEAPAEQSWKYRRADLYHALGVLKPANTVELIRAGLETSAYSTDVFAAVTTLATLDTQASWALIYELAERQDTGESAIRALENCPGEKTLVLLGKLLGEKDPTRRQAAYRAVQRLDPRLLENGPIWIWNEQNEQKLRVALDRRLALKAH